MGKKQKVKKQTKPARSVGGKVANTKGKKMAAKKTKASKVKTKVAKSAKNTKPARPVAKKKVVAKKIKTTKPVAKKVKAKVVVKKVKKLVKPIKKAISKVKSAPKKVKKAVKPIKKALVKKIAKPIKKAKVIAKPIKPAKKAVETKKAIPSKPVKEVKKPIAAIEIPKAKPEKVRKGKGGRKPKKAKGDDDEPEIGEDLFIEEIIKSVKPSRNQPKQPKIIKTFVNPMTALTPIDTGKKGALPKKEPKGKFELEYVVRTSPGILYEFLSSPSGLSEWFADDVNIRDGIFTFYWDGSEQKAKLLALKEEKFIRLSWVDKPDGYYFEFRIERDELTGDVSLIVVDFADEASDEHTSKLLWDSQVNKLLHVIGSF